MANHQFKKLSLDTTTSTSSKSTHSDAGQNGYSNGHSLESAVIDEGDEDEDNSSKDGDGLIMQASPSRDSDVLRLRKELRARGTSIKFDPEAKLDNGHVHTLETPLPGKQLHESPLENGHAAYRNRHDGHRGYEAPAHAIPIRQRQRRHSETDQEEFDALTGEPLVGRTKKRGAYHQGEMRHPLLQSTVDELAQERGFGERDGLPPSLTSERTASPVMEEIQTPRNGHLLSPVQVTASPTDFASRESKALPSRRSVSQRSFGSLGSAGRRHTIKSNNSSLSSPARSFLSQWTRGDDAVKEPEPDEEGQEIGDDSGYIIGRKIGYGGFSVVKEATTFEHGRRVVRAVKIVRKQIRDKSEHENDKLQSEFDREVGVWRYLKHAYILPLIAVYESSFATFCITQLNTGGTVFDLIRTRRKTLSKEQRGLPAHLAKRYIYQLGSAIRYLHEDVRVVHRDIKPENCLLDMSGPTADVEGGTLLLCDFGMADFIHNEHRPAETDEDANGTNGNVGPALTSTNIQGSLEYTAPELFRAGRPVYSVAADMWAYGCVMYALLTGSMAFSHEFLPRLVLMIEKGGYDVEALRACATVAETGDEAAVELAMGCLELDPERRFEVSDVLAHRFLNGCEELYEPREFS